MLRRTVLLVACFLIPLISHAQESAILDTLSAQAEAFSEAYMRGDAEAMAAIYTDDAAIFPGGRDIIKGRAAIRDYWTLPEGFEVVHHRILPEEVRAEGDMAYDYGYYEFQGRRDGEAGDLTTGKYLVVWQRGTDGVWRMHLDMWNSLPRPDDD